MQLNSDKPRSEPSSKSKPGDFDHFTVLPAAELWSQTLLAVHHLFFSRFKTLESGYFYTLGYLKMENG